MPQTIEQPALIPYGAIKDMSLRQLEIQQETAIAKFKQDYCPSCANYNSSKCKNNSFTREGNCWFYTHY